MGFNTWNLYHCSVDSDILTSTATAMVQTGLKDAGYIYVNSVRPRVDATTEFLLTVGAWWNRTTAG